MKKKYIFKNCLGTIVQGKNEILVDLHQKFIKLELSLFMYYFL